MLRSAALDVGDCCRYCAYLPEHIRTVRERFVSEHHLCFFTFTDDPRGAEEIFSRMPSPSEVIPIRGRSEDASSLPPPHALPCRGFPADTLYRYHYFLSQSSKLKTETDVVFYLDVDVIVEKSIAPVEIFPTRDRLSSTPPLLLPAPHLMLSLSF